MKLSADFLILNENLSLFPHLWLKAGDNAVLLLMGGLMKLNDVSVSPQVVCGCIGVLFVCRETIPAVRKQSKEQRAFLFCRVTQHQFSCVCMFLHDGWESVECVCMFLHVGWVSVECVCMFLYVGSKSVECVCMFLHVRWVSIEYVCMFLHGGWVSVKCVYMFLHVEWPKALVTFVSSFSWGKHGCSCSVKVQISVYGSVKDKGAQADQGWGVTWRCCGIFLYPV